MTSPYSPQLNSNHIADFKSKATQKPYSVRDYNQHTRTDDRTSSSAQRRRRREFRDLVRLVAEAAPQGTWPCPGRVRRAGRLRHDYTLQKIEAGERRPSRQIAERLAEALDIEPDKRGALIEFARSHSALGASVQLHPSSNLPAPVTPLIGRERDIVDVRRRFMRDDTRLLTLVGPPGIGESHASPYRWPRTCAMRSTTAPSSFPSRRSPIQTSSYPPLAKRSG